MNEHDEYLTKRNLKFQTPKKHFPIYRKKMVNVPNEIKLDLSKKTNKKYAHVKPKVKTFFTAKTQIY